MVKILPSCLIRGNNLVSVDIEEYPNLKMKKIIKKGQLVSYIIEAKMNLEYKEDYFEYILLFENIIKKNKMLLQKLNYDKIVLDLCVYYLYQCNMEFDNNILCKINKTFDNLFISCYELSEDDFNNIC